MEVKFAQVESFKYPDIPRYFYPSAVITDCPEYLLLYSVANTPCWNGKTGQLVRLSKQSMNVLYPDRDYNVVLFWENDWTFTDYYVNIALPMEWDGQICRYIDLDLDVVWLTERSRRVLNGTAQPGVFVLDRDEYEFRKYEYNFSPELMERTEQALQTALDDIAARIFPFDDSLLDWRPSPELLEAIGDLPDSAAMWHFNQQ